MVLNNICYVELVLEFSWATLDGSRVLSYKFCYVPEHDPWLTLTLKGGHFHGYGQLIGPTLAGICTASLNYQGDE